jgi:hypothetical protein
MEAIMRRLTLQVPRLMLITGGAEKPNNIQNTFRTNSVKVFTGFFKERNPLDKKVTPHDDSYNDRLINNLLISNPKNTYYTEELKPGDLFQGYDTSYSIEGAIPLTRSGTPNEVNADLKNTFDPKEIDAFINTPIKCITDGVTYHIHPSAFDMKYKATPKKIEPALNSTFPVAP